MKKIYLDHNATTQLDPQVIEAMERELHASFGNPSSIHSFGLEARNRLTKARRALAEKLSLHPQEILFTSGGTEAMNQLLFGYAEASEKGHIITSSVEHSCVFRTMKKLEQRGWEVSFLSPGLYGAISEEQVQKAVRPHTKLISLMAANNETGAKTDIEAIGAFASEQKIPFIVDGIAQFGKEPLHLSKGVLGLGVSAHKFHGPKGVGFAIIRPDLPFSPILTGGGQEGNRRAGTENLVGIMGLVKAVELACSYQPVQAIRQLRDHFEQMIKEELPETVVNGAAPRICNTTNLSFPGVDGESLLMNLDLAGVAVSHGSACSSGALEPSRVLLNMGVEPRLARSALRFSMSRMTVEEEIEEAAQLVIREVKKIKAVTSGYES